MTIQADAGLMGVEEAFSLAVAAEEGAAVAAPEAPGPAEEADPILDEQTLEGDEGSPTDTDDNDIFADLDEPDGEGTPSADVVAEIAALVATDGADIPKDLDTLKQVLKDQRDGYLRQADYTKKTQALAEERKTFEAESAAAKRLYDELARDPAATVAYLAEQVGLVEQGALGDKVKHLQGAWEPPLTGEALEAEIERRVEARLSDHPDLMAAREQAAIARVNEEFAAIEQKHGVVLSDKARMKMLERASAEGTSNLGLVFNAMQAEVQQRRQQREAARAAATARPGPRDSTSTEPPKVKSVEDAFALALEEHAAAA